MKHALEVLMGVLLVLGAHKGGSWVVWALFGNDEDGPDGSKTLREGETPFMSGSPKWKRYLYWWIRNPFHNLFFHVLGVYGKDFKRFGKFPEAVFPPQGKWNYCVIRYGFLFLPFVSYLGKTWKWYAGWRQSGALGFKFIRNRDNA